MEASVAGEIDRIDAVEVVEKEVVDGIVDSVGKLGIPYAFDIPDRLIRRMHDIERFAQNLLSVTVVVPGRRRRCRYRQLHRLR